MRAFEHRDVSRESDGERRKQVVHCDHPRELHSRQEDGIHGMHAQSKVVMVTSNATAQNCGKGMRARPATILTFQHSVAPAKRFTRV